MSKVISLIIQSTDGSDKKQTNEQIKLFAQKLIALTTDSYQGVTKVTKESVI